MFYQARCSIIWSDTHESAFHADNELISKATALRYYDPFFPVTLQVDASEDAIGGVLLLQDQPVCFTSHTMSNTEKQYAQIEKECLAIVTCMNKWHQYLYGKQHITVHTDYQPLESIFKKPISKALRRLQRMMLKLLDYQSQPWQRERVCSENCKEHFKGITGRGPLYCSAGISQYTSAGLRLFPGTEIDV